MCIRDSPHKIFEQGTVSVRESDSVTDYEMLCCAVTHRDANFTEIKQILEAVLRPLGHNCSVRSFEHSSFIPGRCGEVLVANTHVGVIGEVCPEVLNNFGLSLPVACFEISLTSLKNLNS